MNANPSEIGERIKASRKAAKLSQTELAVKLGKTLRTIQKYESGEIEPSIATINAIAKILNVSPAYLVGYHQPELKINSLSDVMSLFVQLDKKSEIRYEIDVKRPPHHDGWSCSIRFEGNNADAQMNSSLCLFFEALRDQRLMLETYASTQESFEAWLEKELAYHSSAQLTDKETEIISNEERLKRYIALMNAQTEAKKKTDKNGSLND